MICKIVDLMLNFPFLNPKEKIIVTYYVIVFFPFKILTYVKISHD